MDVIPYGIRSQLECISRAVLLSQPVDITKFLEAHLMQMVQFADSDRADLKEVAFRYQEQWESDFLMTISRQREIAEIGVRLSSSSLSITRSLTLLGAEKLAVPQSLPYEEFPLTGSVEICGTSQKKKQPQSFTVRVPSQKETKVVKKSSAPVVIQLPNKPSPGTKTRVVCNEHAKEERKAPQTIKHPPRSVSPTYLPKASPQKKPRARKTPKTNTDNFTCTLEDCSYHKAKDQTDQDKKPEPVRPAPVAQTVHKYRGVKKPEVGPGSEIRIPYRPKGGMIFDPELMSLSPKV